jgi:hypothetical protein
MEQAGSVRAGSSRKYVMARSMDSCWHVTIFSGFQGGSAAQETAKRGGRVCGAGAKPQLPTVDTGEQLAEIQLTVPQVTSLHSRAFETAEV